MYGGDLRESLTMRERATGRGPWVGGYLSLEQAKARSKTWETGTILERCVRTPDDYVADLEDVFKR